MPKSLYPKKEPRPIPWGKILLIIMFLIIVVLAIALAVACTSPYNMTWA